jgi:hypothetical protein
MNLIFYKYLIALLTLALAIPVTTTRVVATSSFPIVQNNQHGSRIAQQRGLGGFPHERLLQDSRGNRTISSRQNSNQLIDRAKQLYQDEQYVEASKVWQQTVTPATREKENSTTKME